jgi:predicted kinase
MVMENNPDFEIKDIDIVYRKFSPEDFAETEFEVSESEVEPNVDGYVSEEIYQLAKGKLNQENSTIINAAVGQGKTTAVFKIIKDHFENTNDVIIIAVPFRALVEKYKDEIASDINAEVITTIFDLEGDETSRLSSSDIIALIQRRIHIVTVNLLLRNSGDFFYQNETKKSYLDNFIERLSERNRKVTFFFDEIHAAIHNFSSENIFSFFKFSPVTRKIYYISATYNEASLMVVRFLSKTTNNKIHIINSKRSRSPKADLHIIITAKTYSGNNTEELKIQLEEVIERTINKGIPLNILTYSKALAKAIVGLGKFKSKDSVYSIFKNIGVEKKLKLLVAGSKTDSSTNEIDEDVINVGTTFNTGIDILAGTFIVIMPDSYLLNDINMKYGIFSNGSNSVFQAIGRMRGEGGIYVVTGKTKNLIYPKDSDYANKLSISKYFRIDNNNKLFPYSNNDDSRILNNYYQNKYYSSKIEIDNHQVLEADEGMGLALRYPTFAEWVMEYGEKFLSSNYLFYGKQLTPILVWSAIHNQFHNCNLKSLIFESRRVDFNSDKLFNECYEFVEYVYSEDLSDLEIKDDDIISGIVDNLEHRLYSSSDYEIYLLLIDKFNEYDIYIDNKLLQSVDVKLKSVIIDIIYYRKKGFENYNKGNYLLDLISFSNCFEFNDGTSTNILFRNENLVVLGSQLKSKIDELYTVLSQREYIYTEFKSDHLSESYKVLLEQIVRKCQEIKNVDELVSIKGFDLFRKSNIGYTYKQIYQRLFITEEFSPNKKGRDFDGINGTNGKVIKLMDRNDFTNLTNGVNSFYSYTYQAEQSYYSHNLKFTL